MYPDHRVIPHTVHSDLIPEVPGCAGGVVIMTPLQDCLVEVRQPSQIPEGKMTDQQPSPLQCPVFPSQKLFFLGRGFVLKQGRAFMIHLFLSLQVLL